MQLPHPRMGLAQGLEVGGTPRQVAVGEARYVEYVLGLLPKPLTCERQQSVHEHTNTAELLRLVYGGKPVDSQELFHGITFRGVLGIMHRSFEGRSKPALHEFSSTCGPGVYCADKWHGSL